MELIVLRFSSQEDSTSGILFEKTDIKLRFLCYTLEDEARVLKVKGETRVPEGTYEIEYILIHTGNTDEHTAGCLLIGDSQENNTILKDGFVGKSTNAYKRIYPPIAKQLELGNKVTIQYIDHA